MLRKAWIGRSEDPGRSLVMCWKKTRKVHKNFPAGQLILSIKIWISFCSPISIHHSLLIQSTCCDLWVVVIMSWQLLPVTFLSISKFNLHQNSFLLASTNLAHFITKMPSQWQFELGYNFVSYTVCLLITVKGVNDCKHATHYFKCMRDWPRA